jgi:pimeloyl-ACP methyl ester carboxylesterase
VDWTGALGNRDDFDNLNEILDPTMMHFAPFKGLCAQYAPKYRQITLQTYGTTLQHEALERATDDVEAAFDHYLAEHNDGRDVALIGHSQGSHVLQRLMARRFDGNAELTSKLVVAMLIGPVGEFHVPAGERLGGTFDTIPLCAAETERGCVLTYNSFHEGAEPQASYPVVVPALSANDDVGCTNPADLTGAPAPAAGALLPNRWRRGDLLPVNFADDSGPDFLLYRDFYTLECAAASNGRSFLKVSAAPAPGDQRTNRVPFSSTVIFPADLGTHLFDFAFGGEDLKNQLRARLP